MLSRRSAEIFILVFLLLTVGTYCFQRELWPFSKFGMYGELYTDRPKCVFDVKFIGRNPQYEPTHIRLIDYEYLTSLLYSNLDCQKIIESNGRGYAKKIRTLFQGVLAQIKGQNKNRVIRVQVLVRMFYWESWNVTNSHRPDIITTIFEDNIEIR